MEYRLQDAKTPGTVYCVCGWHVCDGGTTSRQGMVVCK